MQTQRTPVLIFAQSGRFLAQSASQAGFTVWLADCYGDIDSLSVATRWQTLPAFTELTHECILKALSELAQGEECILICGSGIEHCYQMLHSLPPNIHLIGNTADTIRRIKNPKSFFDLLSQLQIAYPHTQLIPPRNESIWLKKKTSGSGGAHIEYATFDTNEQSAECYYQRFVSGRSGSCLFLANGHEAHIVSINQQHLASNSQFPFLLGRIESGWQLSTLRKQYLYNVVNQLSSATHLVGLNSLDFIISEQNELLVLEINPRPSASVELIKNNTALFKQHIDASLGHLAKFEKMPIKTKASLFYHYATSDCLIPEKMEWPMECHDLPHSGTIIKKNEPICTSRVEFGEHSSAIELHRNIELKVLKQLHSAT